MSLRKRTGNFLHRLPVGLHGALPPRIRVRLRHYLGQYGPWELGFDHTPPIIKQGEHPGPPDFIGIGVQKAGTSWWFDRIVAHPGVFSSDSLPKERHYFSQYGYKAFSSEAIQEYHNWFPRTDGTITGEWTPDYIYSPWVPALIAQSAPKAKLLVVLRDPVERFRSGITHSINMGESYLGIGMNDAIARGLYFAQLQRWLHFFSRDQILVLQYEKCKAEPIRESAKTYRFLGLDDRFVAPDARNPLWEVSTRDKIVLDSEVRSRLVEVYARDVAQLVDHFPELDLSLWKHFEELI